MAAIAVLLMAARSSAAPYASAVTVTGDTVTFILNESADSVKVVFDGGASTLVIGTSPEPAGTKTFSKAGHTSYRIEVEKNAGPGWKSGVLQQISQDSNDLVKFANGRGVTVNRLPGTGPLFGRIYTTVATGGNAAPQVTPPVTPRNDMLEGIYVLNPDFTGTTLGTDALTGGLTFDTGTTGAEGPYRLTIGEGGDLFITDWSDTNGSVYKTDGNVAGGKNLLSGPVGSAFPIQSAAAPDPSKIHGSIAAVVTEGSEAANNLRLWVIDEDLQTDPTATGMTERNSIWEWNQGGELLPMINPPVKFTGSATIGIGFAAQTSDLARSPDGTFYKLQRRSAGLESGIFAVDATGNGIPSHPDISTIGSRPAFQAFSGESTAADPFLEAGACDVSEDNWLAVLRRSDNAIHLVKTNLGILDFSSHILLYTTPVTTIARDIAFDIAGNLYTIGSGQALLRVYAPGGHTRATTSSTGTFEIIEVTPTPVAPPLVLAPAITSVTRVGDDLVMPFSSRLGLASTIVLQRTPDMDQSPWETMVNPAAPAPAIFSIVGSPPNFTFRAIGAFASGGRYFYRVKRN